MSLLSRLGAPTPFDEQHTFVTSPFFSSFVLAVFRLVFALYALFTLLFIIIHEYVKEHSRAFFSYFTHLSLIGLCAYFFAAAVQTFAYARAKRKGYPLQRWPKVLQFLHVLLHSTIITFPILVTVVFFALIADKDTFSTAYNAFSNISQHVLNTVFAVFEIFMTHAQPSPWLHLPILVAFGLSYLGIAYITRATQGLYVYSFLDPHKKHGPLVGYIIGIAVLDVITYLVVRYAVVGREYIFTHSVRRSAPTGEKLEEWENVERPPTPIAI